jgi:hypothetical protein
MFNQLASYDDKSIVFRKANGMFYNIKKIRIGANDEYQLIPAGAFYFDHVRKNKLAEEERQVSDEQTPIINYRRTGKGQITSNSGLFAPLVGDRVHKKTGIKNAKTGDVKEEKDTRGAIMFCYAIGMQRGAGMGTTTIYDAAGVQRAGSSLALCYGTNEGIVKRFWQAREKYLADALLPMTVKLNMPVSEILKIDMYKPKLINGMKSLLSSFKYQTGKSQVKITEAKFLTLRRQQPDTNFGYGFNFFEPTETGYNYYWVKHDNFWDIAYAIVVEPIEQISNWHTDPNEPTVESIDVEPTVDDYMASAGGQKFFEQTDMTGDITILGTDPNSYGYTRYEIIIYSVWFTVGRTAI